MHPQQLADPVRFAKSQQRFCCSHHDLGPEIGSHHVAPLVNSNLRAFLRVDRRQGKDGVHHRAGADDGRLCTESAGWFGLELD